MQHIGIRIEDEDQALVRESDINFVDIFKRLQDKKSEQFVKNYPWVASIDPYGNTIFNPFQLVRLKEELETIKETVSDTELTQLIDRLLIFCEIDTHQYLKFIGD